MKVKATQTNGAMNKAKKVKDNEYYTRECDIDVELNNYAEKFKGKTLYCCCDDPRWSKFWAYLHRNFTRFGLKCLISTFFSDNPEDKPFKSVYRGGNDEDITVAEKYPLEGNGDFLSEEIMNIIEGEADAIVTNPPFSLFKAFVERLIVMKKDFLMIGPITASYLVAVLDGIIDGSVQVGFNRVVSFTTQTGESAKVSCIWLTSMAETKYDTIRLALRKRYYDSQGKPFWDVDKRYPKYDDFPIIDISEIEDIPCDFKGYMGVPISYLQWYNPSQFAILGQVRPKMNGKSMFTRIIVQSRDTYNEDESAAFVDSLRQAGQSIVNVKADRKGKTERSKGGAVDDEYSIWAIQ